MSQFPQAIVALADALTRHWTAYREQGDFDLFVEFTLALNGLTEQLNRLHLPGLVRACQELESTALTLLGESSAHPLPAQQADDIARQLRAMLAQIKRPDEAPPPARRSSDADEPGDTPWQKPRTIRIISHPTHPWTAALSVQLGFFGFTPEVGDWQAPVAATTAPLAIVFIPTSQKHNAADAYTDADVSYIKTLRAQFPTSYFYCLAVPGDLQRIIQLQRAGADDCVPAHRQVNDVLSRILDLVETSDEETHRVLVVEDSATAIAHIRRSLSQQGIDSLAISDPRTLLETAASYHPDAILMDMYMPFCSGVEVTSALRQIPEYQALPVIYLSSEADIAQQVEALRLGGDQFLTKPVNPIILASVVQTKIERYREMLYASRHDSMTGLLNHTSSKEQLKTMLRDAGSNGNGRLVVAMIDIDRFKSINDTYGHPVGDQVIRGLAWLLRGRLRKSDLIGRYGGEEFIVALPGIELSAAVRLLDRIREDFSALPHAHASGTLRASFSCGTAACSDYPEVSALIQAADDALLQAKRNGRNQVLTASASLT